MAGITGDSKKILDFILKFHKDNRYWPRRNQISAGLNMAYPKVHATVGSLADTGYIDLAKSEAGKPIIDARATPKSKDA